VCHPQLGLPQSGCIGPRALVIEPTGGGGGKRRRRRQAPHHGGHRPRRGTGNLPDSTHLHWSTGLTPRTTGTSDRAVTAAFTNLADPSRTTTAATSAFIHRSCLIRLQYAAGSVESVQQPGALAVHLLRHPVWQRLCAWVLGLDIRAKSLSGGDGRRGAAPRKWRSRSSSALEEQIQWRSKRESTRPRDGGAFNVGEGSGVDGISEGATVEEEWWANRVNPNATVSFPPFLSLPPNPRPYGPCRPLGLSAGPNGLSRAPLWARPISTACLISFKEIGPLLFIYFSLLFIISLQFKFSLNLNPNLVSIPANLCNTVEISVI
jgi:hypothetical protein